MNEITAAAKTAAPTGAIGGGILVVILVGGTVWYCVAHKGRDWPTILMGYTLCLAIGMVGWGAALNSTAAHAIASGIGAIVHAVSNMG